MNALSKTENKVVMAQARDTLKGKWGVAVGTTAVYLLISGPFWLPRMGGLFAIFLAAPLSLGLAIFSLAMARKRDAKLAQLFQGFGRYGLSLGAYVLRALFVLLWSLLLVVPGIVAALSYRMTFYVIAEDDSIGPLEALAKSKELMRGNKWKLFRLHLRFTGWLLLCLLTCGIGFLWLIPYVTVSTARFYDDLKAGEVRTAPN